MLTVVCGRGGKGRGGEGKGVEEGRSVGRRTPFSQLFHCPKRNLTDLAGSVNCTIGKVCTVCMVDLRWAWLIHGGHG
jgi:hypothetical protein